MRADAAALEGMSSMRTTSAASTAASEPMAPMAIPTSARASTGASLMPSPSQPCQAAPSSPMSVALPTATLLPLTVATIPLPATSVVSRTEQSSPSQGKASCSASAMGCVRVTLGVRGKVQEPVFVLDVVVHRHHLEDALGIASSDQPALPASSGRRVSTTSSPVVGLTSDRSRLVRRRSARRPSPRGGAGSSPRVRPARLS